MFTNYIYAEAIFVINFELAPAPFSFGKYLFQIFLLDQITFETNIFLVKN